MYVIVWIVIMGIGAFMLCPMGPLAWAIYAGLGGCLLNSFAAADSEVKRGIKDRKATELHEIELMNL